MSTVPKVHSATEFKSGLQTSLRLTINGADKWITKAVFEEFVKGGVYNPNGRSAVFLMPMDSSRCAPQERLWDFRRSTEQGRADSYAVAEAIIAQTEGVLTSGESVLLFAITAFKWIKRIIFPVGLFLWGTGLYSSDNDYANRVAAIVGRVRKEIEASIDVAEDEALAEPASVDLTSEEPALDRDAPLLAKPNRSVNTLAQLRMDYQELSHSILEARTQRAARNASLVRDEDQLLVQAQTAPDLILELGIREARAARVAEEQRLHSCENLELEQAATAVAHAEEIAATT